MRKQFTFYVSFFEALSLIEDDADRVAAYDALCNYALFGVEPDVDKLSNITQAIFLLIKPTLDAGKQKATSGERGGKQNRSKAEARREEAGREEAIEEQNEICFASGEKQNEICFASGEKQTQSEKEVEKEKEKEVEVEVEVEKESYPPVLPGGKTPPSKRFVPPSVEEVTAYCQQRHNSVNPRRFVDFYASKGWLVGKTPMKDWRAAVRTWENDTTTRAATAQSGGGSPSAFAQEAVRRMMAAGEVGQA